MNYTCFMYILLLVQKKIGPLLVARHAPPLTDGHAVTSQLEKNSRKNHM